MDMVIREKAAAMNPEKGFFWGTVQETIAPRNEYINHRASEASTPGVFRVDDAPQQHSQRSISVDSVSSEGSESCVVIIPRASLVEDDKDVEAPTTDIPIVIADDKVESVESVIAKARSGRSRMFRPSVLACLFLIIVLLAGIFIMLLDRDESSKSTSPSSKSTSPSSDRKPPPPFGKDGLYGDGREGGKDDGGNRGN
jgi:hypothetical protein